MTPRTKTERTAFAGFGEYVMSDASIKPAMDELERTFVFLAGELWFKPRNVFLPLPVITVQTRGRRNALGWFWKDKWQERDTEKRIPELNICAEHLQADLYDIANTLLHEMCHYANFLRGIKDCSSNQYHNRKFRRECNDIGLICKETGRHGWADTELTPELRQLVDDIGFCEDAFRIFRGEKDAVEEGGVQGEETGNGAAGKKKQKLAKWSCSCPINLRVAAGRNLDATCNVCMFDFERAE